MNVSGPQGHDVQGSQYSPDKSKTKMVFQYPLFLTQTITNQTNKQKVPKTRTTPRRVLSAKWNGSTSRPASASSTGYNPCAIRMILFLVNWILKHFCFCCCCCCFRNDNGQDVYAHYSAITSKNPNHRVRSLAEGELVQFNVIQGTYILIFRSYLHKRHQTL